MWFGKDTADQTSINSLTIQLSGNYRIPCETLLRRRVFTMYDLITIISKKQTNKPKNHEKESPSI